VSIKPLDPHTITLEEAIELYGAKEKADIDKYIAIFKSGIKVVKGQYGPYITDGKKNAKIPKDTDPTSLTEKDCQELLAKAPARKKFRRRKQ
jgi:DNA topoisomerase-1